LSAHFVPSWNSVYSVEGYCSNVPAGYRTIKLKVARCRHYVNDANYPVGDAETGWNGNGNRIMVEEIKLGTDVTAGIEYMYRIIPSATPNTCDNSGSSFQCDVLGM